MSAPQLHQRAGRGGYGRDGASNVSFGTADYEAVDLNERELEKVGGGLPQWVQRAAGVAGRPQDRSRDDKVGLIVGLVLTALAFCVRFYRISHPDEVVFDEVHFGKFAAYYILREYYFDVHPPLAKMLNGLSGWLVGFDGHFDFENIGDSYTAAGVPYVGMRALPAIMGALTIPVIYGIMRESGYPVIIAAFSAALILFDNGHVAQTRLILLDAALVLFMTLSLYAYIRFYKLRHREFTMEWWGWQAATGFFLACTLGCKMVGLFTFLTVGTAVAIDLWKILDIRRGHTMSHVGRHVGARVLTLIVLPAIVYLSFFWIHFKVLKYSGTGDSFMSPAFQETLEGNPLLLNSQEIRYYDTVTIQHKDTKVFLHSHLERYPLRYEDGRISSQGQQVTGYPHNDTNNHWTIVPTKELPETGRGRVVRHKDVVQLLHVQSNSHLLTHDVASPLTTTNQEFTTWPAGDESRKNDTLFQIMVTDAHEGEPLKSKAGHFRFVHVSTKVSMYTWPNTLPDWAFKQQEINGNKNAQERAATWFVDEIVDDETHQDPRNRTGVVEARAVRHVNFFKKFFELQLAMLQHNAGLTASHPYASNPIEWPFMLKGISFWTKGDVKEQIYMIGNIFGGWSCVMALSIFVGIWGADHLARRRGQDPIPDPVRNRLHNSVGFFIAAWAFHYFPFFLMSRQLFIHHYLPAQVASALVAGAVVNFIATESINYPVSVLGPSSRLRPRTYANIGRPATIGIAVFIAAIISVFIFFSPLTYGTPGLEGDQVLARKLLSSWTLHFSPK